MLGYLPGYTRVYPLIYPGITGYLPGYDQFNHVWYTGTPEYIPNIYVPSRYCYFYLVPYLVVVVPDAARVLDYHPHAQVQVNDQHRCLQVETVTGTVRDGYQANQYRETDGDKFLS